MPVLNKEVRCPTCGCTCSRGNFDENKNIVKGSSSRVQGAGFLNPQAQSTPDIKHKNQLLERKQTGRKNIIKARLVKNTSSSSENNEETLESMSSLLDKSLQEKCTIIGDISSDSDTDPPPPWLQNSVKYEASSCMKNQSCGSILKRGSKLNVISSRKNEFMDVGDVAYIDFNQVASSIVTFLNTEYGGDLYIGVDDDQVVYGVMSNRQQRDKIRQELDRICSQKIDPRVTPKNVSIDFLKIHFKGGSDDLRVIKISVIVTEITNMINFSLKKAHSR